MIGGDELVLHRHRLIGGGLEDLDQLLIGLRLGPTTHFRQMRQFGLGDPLEVARIDADLLEQRPHDPLPLGKQGPQEMHRCHLRIAVTGRLLHRSLHGLLGLDREFVESKRHAFSLLYWAD